MKKLYTLALAAAVALSAVASEQIRTFAGKQLREVSPVAATAFDINFNKAAFTPAKAPAKAPASIAGDYTIYLGDYYFESSINDVFTADCQILQEGTEIAISCDDLVSDVAGTYNATTGKITFDKQYVGTYKLNVGECPVFVVPTVWDSTISNIVQGSYSVDYDTASGNIVFEADHGFGWLVYNPGDNNGTGSPLGWLDLYDVIGLEAQSGWVTIDGATFNENIITPLFTGEENTAAVDVEVKYNEATNSLKVIDPLKAFYTAQGWNSASPAMTLDITDPTNVSLPMTSSGISTQADGVMVYLSQSFYSEATGETLADEEKIVCTQADGKLVVTFPYHSTIVIGQTSQQGYYGSAFVSTLTVPMTTGIANVTIDNNAPVVYYNLQGVRVANPENGIFIRRQGNTATKVLVK